MEGILQYSLHFLVRPNHLSHPASGLRGALQAGHSCITANLLARVPTPHYLAGRMQATESRHKLIVYLLLPLILALATALRLWGITWGLPDSTHLFSYHPDEYHSLRGLFSLLLTGSLNPHFFNYGSLYLYLVAIPAALLHGGLVQQLEPGASPDLALRAWTLDARLVSVLAALGTVVVVYAIGRRLAGPLCGLWAAALLTVMPLHVLHSHYGTVDVTQALFIALCLLFTIKLYQDGDLASAIGAGAMAGLAASVKYNGALVIVAPLVTYMAVSRRRPRTSAAHQETRLRGTMPVATLAACLLAFVLTSPYTFLAWGEASEHIAHEIEHMRIGEHPAVEADPSAVLFHLKNLAWPGAGLLLPVALIGLVMLLQRHRRESWPLVVFTVLWFVMISAARVRYARYEVPLTPVLAVAGAYALARWAGHLRYKRIATVLLALTFGLNATLSYGIAQRLASSDPRQEILRSIISGSASAQATIGIISEPWFGLPPLDYCNGGTVIRHNPLWRGFQRPIQPLVVTRLDPENLKRENPDWFVLSEFDVRDSLRAEHGLAPQFIAALDSRYKLVAQRGGPPPGFALWPLASDWNYPWPLIRLYVRAP